MSNIISITFMLLLFCTAIAQESNASPGCPGCEQKTLSGKEHFENGNLSAAEHALKEVVVRYEQNSGDAAEPIPYSVALQNLGLVYYFEGKLEEAAQTYARALPIIQSIWGESSLPAADDMHNLARTLRRSSKFADAEPIMKRVVEIREHELGTDHPLVSNAYLDLAVNYGRQRRVNEAEEMFNKVINGRESVGHQMRLKASLESYVQFLRLNNAPAEKIGKVQERINQLTQLAKEQPTPQTSADSGRSQKLEIRLLPSVNNTTTIDEQPSSNTFDNSN